MSRRQVVRLVLLGTGAVAVVVVVQLYGLAPVFSRVAALFREAGALPFFTAMAVLPAFGAPVSLFTFPAAAAFAPTLGVAGVIACAVAAVSVNMALTYWLAARGLRPTVKRLLERLGHRMPELPDGTAWEIALLVRIVPGPPLFVQSYLLGLARLPFGIYMAVSVVVTGTYTVITIIAIDGLRRGDPVTFVLAGVVFVVVGLTVRRLRVRLQRRTADNGGGAPEDSAGADRAGGRE